MQQAKCTRRMNKIDAQTDFPSNFSLLLTWCALNKLTYIKVWGWSSLKIGMHGIMGISFRRSRYLFSSGEWNSVGCGVNRSEINNNFSLTILLSSKELFSKRSNKLMCHYGGQVAIKEVCKTLGTHKPYQTEVSLFPPISRNNWLNCPNRSGIE